MADLVKKKNIRDGHRAVAQRRLTEADTVLGDIATHGTGDVTKVTQLRLALIERLDIVKKLDDEIVDLTADAVDIVTEIDDADVFSQSVYERIAKLEKANTELTAGESRAPTSAAKLPKLNLPVYYGELTSWMAFWDSYKAAVHDNGALTDVEKFNYLRSYVGRTAKEAISGLTLTSANYQTAVDILVGRFGNKDRIIGKHMEALLGIEEVREGDLRGLRAMYDKVEAHTRELKALGLSAETYNVLLPPVLKRKLPSELCLTLSRKIPEDEWQLERIMTELGEELKARERASEGGKRVVEKERYQRRQREPPTGVALLTSTNSCCYCHDTHKAETCRKVVDVGSRKQVLRDSGRCFICLRRGHLSNRCRVRDRCSVCGGRHHVSICLRKGDGLSKESEEKGPSCPSQETPLNPKVAPFKVASLYSDSNKGVLLQTATATVYNPEEPNNELTVRLVFDSGSQRSYVTEPISEQLRLRALGTKEMSIATFGAGCSMRRTCEVVRVSLITREGDNVQLTLLTIPLICEPISCGAPEDYIGKCDCLQVQDLADPGIEGEVNVDILIGLDHYWDLITGEVIRGSEGPIATYSRLGWLLSGPVDASTTTFISHVLTSGLKNTPEKGELDKQLRKFWELEAIGIENKESTLYDQFKQNVKFNGTRYEVTLPWRDTVTSIPDNYELCLRRFKGLFRRLKQQPTLLAEYDRVIKEQLEKGITEVVEDPETTDGDKIHYLPHHAVLRQDKETTKLRVVYDASARGIGPSLNDCLHVGPKFDQIILGILLRFRLFNNAFTADVEKAFLMIGVDKGDRDALRFLWAEDINEETPRIQVIRFTRVAFGVASSPFLLNATIRNHAEGFQESKPTVINKLLRSLYVDDVICGADSPSDSLQYFQEFRDVLSKGGFNLRKLVGNELLSVGKESVVESENVTQTKVLGIVWNVKRDELMIDLRDILRGSSELAPTKRRVVSIASKIHDPLGLVSPVTVNFKVLFQELHVAKVGWDQEITGELRKRWVDMIASIGKSTPIVISRQYFKDVGVVRVGQLCGFSDASMRAYAAVVYLRVIVEGRKRVALVASKTRVAPVKERSIPRLELLGALLLARLINSITSALKEEIQLLDPVCYIDSQVSWYWIKGSNRDWKPFVENRVQEIRRLVPAEHWYHCSGVENPADIPSRGLTPQALVGNQLWLEGPEWLRAEDTKLTEQVAGEMPSECVNELRAAERRECGLLIRERERVSLCVELERFSDFDQLLRVTAYVLKFINILRMNREEREFITFYKEAEGLWILDAQIELVCDRKFKIWEKQLRLFKDTRGIWRCGGRLRNADIPYQTKHPILLPAMHYLTQLIVRRAHERVYHNGVKETLTEVRSTYWIIKGRSVIKRIIGHCVTCKRAEGYPYKGPEPPPLPEFRVKEEPPFTFTGVDFAGPLFVKGSTETKAWICLFTCCVTRAIHTDVLHNMSFESFFRSFRRFTARRGLPKKVLSDNAKTFKKVAKLLREIMSHVDVSNYLGDSRIEWMFNVERAPWWGGVFERMVRSVKRCLKKIIGQARLTFEELLTIVVEIEAIINSRPLSYVTQDDMEEAITPSHLMVGRRLLSVPDYLCYSEEVDDDFEVTRTTLTKRMKHLSCTLDKFWKRWKSEYLLELREAHRYSSQGVDETEIAVGDVVTIHCSEKRRGFWSLGRVEQLLVGNDQKTRAALVRVHDGKGRCKMLRRPITVLYPLEVKETPLVPIIDPSVEEIIQDSADNTVFEETQSPEEEHQSSDNEPYEEAQANEGNDVSKRGQESTRTKRQAASKARDRMLAYSLY